MIHVHITVNFILGLIYSYVPYPNNIDPNYRSKFDYITVTSHISTESQLSSKAADNLSQP